MQTLNDDEILGSAGFHYTCIRTIDSLLRYQQSCLPGHVHVGRMSKCLISIIFHCSTRVLVKSASYPKINFLISRPKHMLWALKRKVQSRRFFWAPKTYVKTDEKESLYNFTPQKIVYLNLCSTSSRLCNMQKRIPLCSANALHMQIVLKHCHCWRICKKMLCDCLLS